MLRHERIKADICVVGGGMAGVCAAVAAARQGAKVVLMQERPVLGGNASSEIRMWICGADGENMRETGILEEIFLKNYYYNPTKNPYLFDYVLLDTVRREKNITLLLNCCCMDARIREGEYAYGRSIRIEEVQGYQMTTQCFYHVEASYFIDCSGDSILAPLSNAAFVMGREGASEYKEDIQVTEPDNRTMGNSILFTLRETDHEVPHIPLPTSLNLNEENFAHREPVLRNESENFWYLELGGEQNTITQSEEIADDLKDLAIGALNHIKGSEKYQSENFEIGFLGSLPGKRESRRYVGEYTLSQRDVSDEVHFQDTIAFGGWGLDDHFPGGFFHKGAPNTVGYTPAPYPIPYRVLYSKNVDNLLFAGRNISATHTAFSSTRVMATCAIMGQAAGTAAALASKYALSPQGVYEEKLDLLQQTLMNNDCFLPFIERRRSSLCAETPLIGGNDTLKNGEDRANRIYGTTECGLSIRNGEAMTYQWEKPQTVHAVHIVFNSDLDRKTLPGGECERRHASRANTLLSSPVMCVPKTLCKEFVFTVIYADGTVCKKEIKENLSRFYHWELEKDVLSLSLTPLSNWGETDSTDVFSFDFT